MACTSHRHMAAIKAKSLTLVMKPVSYAPWSVNIASRVQGLAMSRSILATAPVVHNPRSASVLGSNGQKPVAQSHALRGVTSEVAVYEIP
jgi:class 3 adenylate cyclase